jgi:uncharacterized protein YbjT (DUF2867 family)
MILVTGAGGSNGSALIKQLSAPGASVRAMVRKRRDLKNDALPGVEFVTADFDDLASVNRALEGVQSAFLVTNSSERTETQQLRFVEAACAAGLRHRSFATTCQKGFPGGRKPVAKAAFLSP